MPRRLLRKLTDVSNGEDFGEIKEKLESEHVPVTLHICTRKDVSFFRIYVDLRQLEQARRLLYERHMKSHPESTPAALFARGQQILKEGKP